MVWIDSAEREFRSNRMKSLCGASRDHHGCELDWRSREGSGLKRTIGVILRLTKMKGQAA